MEARVLYHQENPFSLKLTAVSQSPTPTRDWRHLLAWNSNHLILNRLGQGLVMAPNVRLNLIPGTLAGFQLGEPAPLLMANRNAGPETHEFLVASIGTEGLAKLYPGTIPNRKPDALTSLRRWSERDRQLYDDLFSPPVPESAHSTWRLAKLLELLTLHFFHHQTSAEPLFCAQLKARSHRHVRRALELLDARHSEPLDLQDLADDVGCAPHYLSRLVKQETGKTLSLHLRAFRIGRACELLASNDHNVTEVALEVGYQSLSHFSKAFAAERGMPPSRYLKQGLSPDGSNPAHGNDN